MQSDHPVDDALRRMVGTPVPTDEDRQLAWSRLAEAIDAEQQEKLRARRPWRRTAWAAAFVVVLVGFFVGFQAIAPSPTEAAMEEIASVAEAADPLRVPPQQFLYTRSQSTAISVVPAEALEDVAFDKEFLVYLLPVVRETWFGEEGVVQIRTTNLEPVFFSQRDEDAYYNAGLDEGDNIGETTSQTVTQPDDLDQWPTDLAALDNAISNSARTDRDLPATVEYLDVALDLLSEVFAPPQLRAATLRLIGQLPDLAVRGESEDGTVTLSIEYTSDGIATAFAFTVDPSGYLLKEETVLLEGDLRHGIPGQTAIAEIDYGRPITVDSLDKP